MLFIVKARADRRVAIRAAVIGTSLGLGLGAVYLGVGAAQGGQDHQRIARLATAYGYSEQALNLQASGFAPGAAAIARRHDPFPLGGDAVTPAASGQVVRVQIDYSPKLRGTLVAPEPVRKMARASDASRQVECLTQAVYFEARGEGASGQAAVAQVVMNRVHHPAFPKSVCGVVYQGVGHRGGCQFSFACDGAADRGHDLAAWRRAHSVAVQAMSGVMVASIGGATHFHTINVRPDWGPSLMRVAQVGMHVFYRFGHGAGTEMASARRVAPAKAAPELAATPDFRLASAVLINPPPLAMAPTMDKAAGPAPAPEPEDAAVRLLNTP